MIVITKRSQDGPALGILSPATSVRTWAIRPIMRSEEISWSGLVALQRSLMNALSGGSTLQNSMEHLLSGQLLFSRQGCKNLRTSFVEGVQRNLGDDQKKGIRR